MTSLKPDSAGLVERTMTEDQRIEAAARAVCLAQGYDPKELDTIGSYSHQELWKDGRPIARAAIAAYLAGDVVVPGWQLIDTAPRGRKVIAGHFNGCGKWRSFMATYYNPGTLDASDDCQDADEDGCAPEGWYEESETHDDILPTNPTHWMPLPSVPDGKSGEENG